MAIQLTDPKTAELYECTLESDVRFLVPGVYKGLASAAPPQAAEAMIAQGHPAYVRRQGVSEEETAQAAEAAALSGSLSGSLSMCDKE